MVNTAGDKLTIFYSSRKPENSPKITFLTPFFTWHKSCTQSTPPTSMEIRNFAAIFRNEYSPWPQTSHLL
jgi:hypothetical protein